MHRPPGVLPSKASVLTPYVSSCLGLKNCFRSRYPRDVCNIVIPAAYLYAEEHIVFTFHFVSKAPIRPTIIQGRVNK